MATVAFLKGINVGGHRRLRPSVLAKDLANLDVVNIGAAGTFVIRRRVARESIRAEIRKRIPFEVDVMICNGSDILRLASTNPFDGRTERKDIVSFVGIMARRRKCASRIPLSLPADGPWCLEVLACQDRFILGRHRRQMKAITYLGQLERLLEVPLTFRSWSTILAVAAALRA